MEKDENRNVMAEAERVVEEAIQLCENCKRPKRKMKTNKKAFLLLTVWAMLIQTYVMIMIVKLQDTTSLAIITGVVFGEIIAFYLGYLKYTRDINLKDMELNYDPNYDENKNIY